MTSSRPRPSALIAERPDRVGQFTIAGDYIPPSPVVIGLFDRPEDSESPSRGLFFRGIPLPGFAGVLNPFNTVRCGQAENWIEIHRKPKCAPR